jgi:hypothetical protein
MRRRSDSFLNATQILKVAGIDKGKRTKILEKDIAAGHHEKVQGGYGRYQGTWSVARTISRLPTRELMSAVFSGSHLSGLSSYQMRLVSRISWLHSLITLLRRLQLHWAGPHRSLSSTDIKLLVLHLLKKADNQLQLLSTRPASKVCCRVPTSVASALENPMEVTSSKGRESRSRMV